MARKKLIKEPEIDFNDFPEDNRFRFEREPETPSIIKSEPRIVTEEDTRHLSLIELRNERDKSLGGESPPPHRVNSLRVINPFSAPSNSDGVREYPVVNPVSQPSTYSQGRYRTTLSPNTRPAEIVEHGVPYTLLGHEFRFIENFVDVDVEDVATFPWATYDIRPGERFVFTAHPESYFFGMICSDELVSESTIKRFAEEYRKKHSRNLREARVVLGGIDSVAIPFINNELFHNIMRMKFQAINSLNILVELYNPVEYRTIAQLLSVSTLVLNDNYPSVREERIRFQNRGWYMANQGDRIMISLIGRPSELVKVDTLHSVFGLQLFQLRHDVAVREED